MTHARSWTLVDLLLLLCAWPVDSAVDCFANTGWYTFAVCCISTNVQCWLSHGEDNLNLNHTYEECCTIRMPDDDDDRLNTELSGGDDSSPSMVQRVGVVDLIIRTCINDVPMLLKALHSFFLFWPPKWGVVLVFPEGAREQRFASLLPSRVRVFFESVPHALKHAFPQEAPNRPSLFHRFTSFRSVMLADLYSVADFVAIADSDVILHTALPDRLLFDSQERPILHGLRDGGPVSFRPFLEMLGEANEAHTGIDWMASQPTVLHRRHFAGARSWFTRIAETLVDRELLVARERGYIISDVAFSNDHSSAKRVKRDMVFFDWAFEQITVAVLQKARAYNGTSWSAWEGFCPHCALVSYVWRFHREDYDWSIAAQEEMYDEGFAPMDMLSILTPERNDSAAQFRAGDHDVSSFLQPSYTCPALRVITHVGIEVHRDSTGLTGKLSRLYFDRAYFAMVAGLCALPEHVRDCVLPSDVSCVHTDAHRPIWHYLNAYEHVVPVWGRRPGSVLDHCRPIRKDLTSLCVDHHLHLERLDESGVCHFWATRAESEVSRIWEAWVAQEPELPNGYSVYPRKFLPLQFADEND